MSGEETKEEIKREESIDLVERMGGGVSTVDPASSRFIKTDEAGYFTRILRRVDNTAFFEEALEKYGYEGAITPEAEKKLIRKIDLHVLPCLAMCYVFYYVDKTTLSYAAIFGIKTSLNLHGTQYSWLSSLFYFGWLFWAIPSNLIMQKTPTATYLSFNIFLWGVFLMAQTASSKFIHMAVLRVISGAFEAIADPAFMLITTSFYTRAEQPSRISSWYAANGVGVAAGGLLGYAIGHIKGSLPSWRYEFAIIGAICSCWGIGILFLLPSSPATAWFLTRDERLMAVARLRGNQTGIENRTFKWDQFREAFTDIKTFLFFFLGFVANIPNGGISNFSTLIFQGLGFDTLHTSLLGIPQGAFVIFWITLGSMANSRLPKNSRTLVCILFMAPTIGGLLGFLLAPTHANIGRLMCFYMTGSYQASFIIALSLITSNTGGQTKKMIVNACIWLGACVGNIAGPFFFKANQAPGYRLGIGAMLTANCLEVVVFLVLRVVFILENRRRDHAAAKLVSEGKIAEVPDLNKTAFADLTDKQNINFRYVY